MQVKFGSTRMAIIVGKWVFKFPSSRIFTSCIENIFPVLRDYGLDALLFHLKYTAHLLTRSIIANWTEGQTQRRTRASFLVPVSTLGFVNIARFEDGPIPPFSHVHDLLIHGLGPQARQDYWSLGELHSFDGGNFRYNKSGLHMIDYGDQWKSGGLPLGEFIRRHKEELERIFAAAVPPHD